MLNFSLEMSEFYQENYGENTQEEGFSWKMVKFAGLFFFLIKQNYPILPKQTFLILPDKQQPW